LRPSPVFAAVITLAALLPLHAQQARRPSTNSYLVEYHFRDGGDTASTPDRVYSFTVNGEQKAVFNVGSRIPSVSSSFEPVNGNPMVSTQYTYLDVGVNIECTLLELDPKVQLHTAIDLSGLAEKDATPAAANSRNAATNPVIKQTRLDVSTTLLIGKPTVLATIADPVTNRMLQISVTVNATN
jgi:hypothetical protein